MPGRPSCPMNSGISAVTRGRIRTEFVSSSVTAVTVPRKIPHFMRLLPCVSSPKNFEKNAPVTSRIPGRMCRAGAIAPTLRRIVFKGRKSRSQPWAGRIPAKKAAVCFRSKASCQATACRKKKRGLPELGSPLGYGCKVVEYVAVVGPLLAPSWPI